MNYKLETLLRDNAERRGYASVVIRSDGQFEVILNAFGRGLSSGIGPTIDAAINDLTKPRKLPGML